MSQNPIDHETLHRNLIHVLQHGLRTSTYKLATLSSIVDYSVEHCPAKDDAELDVPIADLARRVVQLYWRQADPFDGTQLHQSTSSQSRIMDSIRAMRSAAGSRGSGVSLAVASQLAPEAYRRVIIDVGLCLAQQPLPRLQRLPGSAQSVTFLYDDSFFHDKISLSELKRRNNAVTLRPGVADGLATLSSQLTPTLQSMWVDDILRMNRLPSNDRARVVEHLFGSALPSPRASAPKRPAFDDSLKKGDKIPKGGLATASLAARLNCVFDTERKPDGQPYSTGEVAAKIRQTGFPLTVSAVSQLRSGVGSAPSRQTVKALAKFFGVSPAYLLGNEEVKGTSQTYTSAEIYGPTDNFASHSRASEAAGTGVEDPAEFPKSVVTDPLTPPNAKDPDARDQVIGAHQDDIAAVCQVLPNGCWVAPSARGMRCRPRNDERESHTLPTIPLHRWAWMVDNDLTAVDIPTYLIQIRRSCAESRCCNPEHLVAAAPGGEELTPREVALLLEKSYVASTSHERGGTSRWVDTSRIGRPPLGDNLESISAYCSLTASGCWNAPSSSAVACRAADDRRRDRDLPTIMPHRWAWMVANGRSSNPLPGSMFQVWRHCGNSRCCNPDHLYLTDPDGEESSAEDAEEWLRSAGDRKPEPHGTSAGGRHRAPPSNNDKPSVVGGQDSPVLGQARLFADRLNALFDGRRQANDLPCTSSDVATALQNDGLALSESLIDRLRAGSASAPNIRTIDALAYFFNVEVEYFSAGDHSVDVRTQTPSPAQPSPAPVSTFRYTAREASPTQRHPISVADIGRIITGLTEAISRCLAKNPAETERSSRLASLVAELATLLMMPDDQVIIEGSLLRRIREEWMRSGAATNGHSSIFGHLSELVDDA